jgi:glutaredoxin 3
MTVPTITMYSTAVCPFCIQAERYLKARGVNTIEFIRVDLDPALRRTMMERTGRRTVPQIYIDAFHVGGYEDLVALDRAGGLLPLLAGGNPSPAVG